MPRAERAKQFAPFEALKGLQEALKLKEFEHERVQKGDLSEEDAAKISKTLNDLKKNNLVKIKYFQEGHYFEKEGRAILKIEENIIEVDGGKYFLNDLYDIAKIGE